MPSQPSHNSWFRSLRAHRSTRARLRNSVLVAVATMALVVSCASTGESSSSETPSPTETTDSGEASEPTNDTASTEDPIKIGILLPLSGSLAALGQQMYQGYMTAQELFNESGGVNGRMIEYVVSDAPTPSDATSVAQRLSTDDSITAIMGSYSSSIAIPASAVADKNKKIYWETGSAAAETTMRDLNYLFRTNGSVAQSGYTQTTLDFFENMFAPAVGKDINDVRFAIVNENGPFGTSSAEAVTDLLNEQGWMLVDQISYDAEASDFSSVIEKLKNNQVDVLYAISYQNDAIQLMKQSKALGFTPDLVFGFGAGYTTPDIVEAIGSDVDGIVVSDAAPIGITDDVLSDSLDPNYAEFYDAYMEEWNQEPLVHATIGYVGAMVLFQNVLPEAPDLTAESIIDAAMAVDIPNGGTVGYFGVKFMGPNADPGLHQNERAGFYVMQYQDEKLRTVYPTEAAVAEFQLK